MTEEHHILTFLWQLLKIDFPAPDICQLIEICHLLQVLNYLTDDGYICSVHLCNHARRCDLRHLESVDESNHAEK